MPNLVSSQSAMLCPRHHIISFAENMGSPTLTLLLTRPLLGLCISDSIWNAVASPAIFIISTQGLTSAQRVHLGS